LTTAAEINIQSHGDSGREDALPKWSGILPQIKDKFIQGTKDTYALKYFFEFSLENVFGNLNAIFLI
jgi:hypothetical protein